jgi:hypothetical protein
LHYNRGYAAATIFVFYRSGGDALHALLYICRINFSDLSNCEQIAIYLLAILSLALTVCLRKEGGNIMTCRVARLSPDLEVCSTSKAMGPHLCQICTQSMVECEAWKDIQARSPMCGQPVA